MAEQTDASGRVAREVFLRAMSPSKAAADSASAIADLIEDVFFDKGTMIYKRGEAPEHLYFIVEGTVRLEHESAPAWEFSERSVIGVIDASLDRLRARNAVCKTNVHALRLRIDDWFEVLEENFDLFRGIIINALTGLRSVIHGIAPTGGFAAVPDPMATAGASIDLETASPLNPVERIIVLRDVHAFKRTGIQVIASLAQGVEEVRLRPGQKLERTRDERTIAIVVGGVVELEGGEPPLSARFAPRSIVGGISMAAVDPAAAAAYSIRAVTPAILFRLPVEWLFDVMEDHFELGRALLAHSSEERERLLLLKSSLAQPGSVPAG